MSASFAFIDNRARTDPRTWLMMNEHEAIIALRA